MKEEIGRMKTNGDWLRRPASLTAAKEGRVELKDLTKDDFVRILQEPRNSLTQQQIALLGTEGLEIKFMADAIDLMAQMAFDVNRRSQNIGARRLYTIVERVFEQINFDAPDMTKKKVKITAEFVRERLADIVKDEDLSKFIL